MTAENTQAKATPDEVLADIATKLKEKGGEPVLTGILTQHLLTASPMDTRIADACAAIVKMAEARAVAAGRKADPNGR